MLLNAATVNRISKIKAPATNVKALVDAVNQFGPKVGLDQPHRLAQFLAQIMHESGGLKYNKELWGPTAQQKRYEGRKDLGNTQKGDGSKYRGYGIIQLTGRDNVTRFYKWCVKNGFDVPNFVDKPELIANAPWSGLAAIWFWDQGNQSGKSLNVYADRGDIENITRLVNGGLNGYDDRLSYYDRTALVLLGYGVNDLKKFQSDEKLEADGVSGPLTRQAFQKELLKLSDVNTKTASFMSAPAVVKTTKTVEVKKEVVPERVVTQVKTKSNFLGQLTGAGGIFGTVAGFLSGMDWKAIATFGGVAIVAVLLIFFLRHQLVAAIREIKGQVDEA